MILLSDLLLDYVYDLEAKISTLASSDAASIFNRPYHGLNKTTLCLELIKQYRIGLIKFKNKSGIFFQKNPSIRDMEEKDFFVCLTEKGGMRWEQIFKPKWDKYFVINSTIENTSHEEIEVEAGSKETLEFILGQIQDKIILGSLEDVSLVTPWKPVYWKVLDNGYSSKFKILENHISILATIRPKIEWREPLYI